MIARLPAALLTLGLAAACAAPPTPYQPKAERYGFTETRIEANRHRVTFRGNSRTTREVVETYLLHRAAELALADGADWFRVTGNGVETEHESYASPVYHGPVLFRRHLRGGGLFPDPFDYPHSAIVTHVRRYEAFAVIQTFEGAKPAEEPDAYDAREVIANLGPKIVRPAAGG